MRDEEYRAWLTAQSFASNTISTRLSDARRVEANYGDLDEAFERDGAASLLKALAYSGVDRAQRKPNPSRISIDGDIYNSLSSYRSAVTTYGRFRAAQQPQSTPTPDHLPVGLDDVLAAVERCKAAGSADAYLSTLPGLGKPHRYWLLHEGRRYPSKAIVNDAYRQNGGDPSTLIGGSQAKAFLERLGLVVLDWRAFETARATFLGRMSGFQTFQDGAGTYWDIERGYKNEVIAEVRSLVANAVAETDVGRAIVRALTLGRQGGLPLSWRTLSEVEKAAPDLRDRFFTAVGRLTRANGDGEVAIAEAARELEALRTAGIAGLRRGEVLAIPISVWGTLHPDEATWFKISRIEAMGKRLFGRQLFAGDRFDSAHLAEYLQLVRALFALFDHELGWRPTDLFDVQSFVWVALDENATSEGTMDDAAMRSDPPLTRAEEPESTLPSSLSHEVEPITTPPTNLILYGPPGTGKTYATAVEAVRLCEGKRADDPLFASDSRDALMDTYRALVRRGRIAFVTFHQSYSYEDFVEGLRPVSGAEDGDEVASGAGGFTLRAQDGIFKQIAKAASANRGRALSLERVVLDRTRKVFKMSLGRSWAAEDDRIYQDAIRDGYVVLGYGGEVDWSDRRFDRFDAIKERWREIDPDASGNDPNIAQMFALRANMEIGSLVIVSDGNRRFRAIGEVTGPYQFVAATNGEYNHRRSVRWLWHGDSLPREQIYAKIFSQVSAYQLNSRLIDWEALEQVVAGGGEAVATSGVPEPYVLIIDEINRTNISKVFGELITLLEPDKRIDRTNEIRLRLPYSGETFGVPANLHVIGTMNTADRSIALLDTALRRRFDFRELMPDPQVLEEVDGIDLPTLLATVNERVEYLFDREHQIGHAFFIACRSRGDVDAVMRRKVIPLLAEYFYEDWGKVAAVLGDPEGQRFLERVALKAPAGLAEEGGETRYRWLVRQTFGPDSYAGLQ